jgi:hypothetical protein
VIYIIKSDGPTKSVGFLSPSESTIVYPIV